MTAEGGYNYRIELDVFEGPLDLLLHLVKKHELEILDIPISFITEKYLEYLNVMTSLNLDIAGEYLLMAATLAHIKSRELLPPDPTVVEDVEGEDEEEGDPRQDLIRRLLEYQKYKEAAGNLGERPVVGRNVWTRGSSIEEALSDNVDTDAMAPLAEFPVIKLIEALDAALRRAKIAMAHDVIVERLSVSERINDIADRLAKDVAVSFFSCLRFLAEGVVVGEYEARHEAVVTFLALLEMAKLGLIAMSQPEGEQDIVIRSAVADLRQRVTETVVSGDDYR